MARSRNIKPQFFLNEHLATLTPHARLLFIGLWCLADCKGRLEDRPLRIKAALFPYESIDIDALLNELCRGRDRFIIRYQIGNEFYIEIPNFSKHQNPHKREKDTGSQIPPCPVQGRVQAGTSTVLAPDLHGTSPADSLLLIPDSLTPEVESDCVSENGLENAAGGGGGDDDHQNFTTAQTAAAYLTALNSPHFKRNGWVTGYLPLELKELSVSSPKLTHAQILDCWRDACDLALNKDAKSPQWIKTTFKNKIHAYVPKQEFQAATAQANTDEVNALLTFPFIRHVLTGEIFSIEDMSIADDAPNGLTHSRGAYYPFRQLEGLTEVPTSA